MCAAARSAEQGNPFSCAACGYTHYFSPFTAVGALIVDEQEQMLFIVRGKEPGKGKLGLPGGFVDAGETAEQALVREIYEEVGLKIVRYEFLASFPNSYAFSGVICPVTDLFFVAHVVSLSNFQLQEGEIDDWKLLPVANVGPQDLAFDTHWKAIQAYAGQLNGESRT